MFDHHRLAPVMREEIVVYSSRFGGPMYAHEKVVLTAVSIRVFTRSVVT